MCFECIREASVSDTDSKLSVLNRGTEQIIRFPLDFVLKLGVVLLASTMGMGISSRFCFSVCNYGS